MLIRVTERQTGQTWRRVNLELGRQHQVTLQGPAGTVAQTTQLTAPQAAIYKRHQRRTAAADDTALTPRLKPR